jgi:hypothetical protein
VLAVFLVPVFFVVVRRLFPGRSTHITEANIEAPATLDSPANGGAHD